MKKRFINHLALAGCLTVPLAYLGSSLCLGQGTLIYRDRTAFETTISGITGVRTDVNFQPPLPPGGIDDVIGVRYLSPLTISGITFRNGASSLYLRYVSGSGNMFLNSYDSLIPLSVDMNGPAVAFGADFSSWVSQDYSNFLATVTLDNGTEFTFTAPADPNFTFFGFLTTQPFSSLTFSDGGLIGPFHEEMLDNITVVRVPEPGVIGILAMGCLLFIRRWHARRT